MYTFPHRREIYTKDNFIEIIVKILCNKRPVQSCPDESLIGNILYRILPETNRDEFIEKNSGLVTTLFKGFTHQREYIRYTNTSPINWYTYKRIIPLQENYLINTIGSTPPYIKRQSITPIQINIKYGALLLAQILMVQETLVLFQVYG